MLMVTSSRFYRSVNKTRAETGYRSKSEVTVSKLIQELAGKNGKVLYEKVALPFSYTVNKTYIPDFVIPNKAMFIEVKGLFSQEDRTKMLLVKEAYPHLDIRMVFDKPQNKLSRTSKGTYASWCERNGFPYCSKTEFPPASWVKHKPTKKQLEAFEAVYEKE